MGIVVMSTEVGQDKTAVADNFRLLAGRTEEI
jgi:hypothetical protein